MRYFGTHFMSSRCATGGVGCSASAMQSFRRQVAACIAKATIGGQITALNKATRQFALSLPFNSEAALAVLLSAQIKIIYYAMRVIIIRFGLNAPPWY